MLRLTSPRGFGSRFSIRLQYRHFVYFFFVAAIFMKLVILHNNLHARYIDMNLLDDLIAVGSILLASFWTLWLPPRGRGIALGVLNVLLTVLIFADLIYYRYFGDFLTVPVLLQAGQVGDLGGSIRELIRVADLWLIADWAVWAAFKAVRRLIRGGGSRRQSGWLRSSGGYNAYTGLGGGSFAPVSFGGTARRSVGWRRFSRLYTGIGVFVLSFALTMGPIRFYTQTWAVGLFENNWWNVSLYNVTGLLGFHYYDTSRFLKEHLGGVQTVSAEEQDEIRQWFSEASQRRHADNDLFGAYAGSNVIVIQAEAFMNFMIGKTIGGQEITPNFNKLMDESLYFSNFYHQTGQGRTSDADFSSNSSLHPLPTGSVAVRYPNHTFDVLPQILKTQAGYTADAFHAYEGSFWNRNNMYQAMGYDRFFSKKDFQLDEPLGWSLGDKSFFRQSLTIMAQEKQPFYSFMITLSSHHPYSLPAAVQELDTGEFKGTIFGDYLQAVHYVDAALGEFVEGLKREGLWEHTILAFYGDHDNSITDKAVYEQFFGKSLSDLDMHQIMNQVPLLIHLPDGQHAGVYEEPAGQLDLAPSLLHLLGISSDSYYMMGHNLFAGTGNDHALDRLVVLRSGAFTDGERYYIPSDDNLFTNGSCYDLTSRNATDIEACRAPHEEAMKRLRISDEIITSDLIATFRKED
ncbi:arylsulfatase [Paenibacillus sp. oral taxon 786 str. D14]|uniref:LTA synthase family protein n=1 Tax=Paenibacillus sp. oral taxon 786 TaxID=652715 RepID=UPI0001AFD196|nr:LTA synthase family protein [Paenibacillus sp. oral taxon 786]EES74782.1 arylsulfatase [Paenibacillus sp. oral taxon 786 str. D14]